jgi:hypothetical protein
MLFRCASRDRETGQTPQHNPRVEVLVDVQAEVLDMV